MFSLLSNKKEKSKFMFFSLISLLCIFLLSGCRDSLLDTKTFDEPVSTDLTHVNSKLKSQFFEIPDGIRPEFKEILLSIQAQDQVNQFVTQDWVAQNGIPIWDKIFSPTASGTENSLGTRSSRSVKDMSFIPLKDTITQEIKSFIAAYKVDGNAFGFRLYNKNALLNFFPPNSEAKKKVISMLAIHAFFEDNINGKKKLTLPAPFNEELKDVKIKMKKSNDLNVRSSCYEVCIEWNFVPIALLPLNWDCYVICTYDGPITDISDYGGGSSCSLCSGGLGSTGSSTGGGSPNSGFTALDGLIYNGSFLATLNAALEPGGITEHDFAQQYPEYVTLLHNLKALNQYLTNFDNTDLEFFARNPESIIPLTTFFAQGGSISDGIQHKNLLKEDPDYLAANKQAGFPTVGSESWEKNVVVPFLGPELVIEYTVWCAVLKKQNPTWPDWKIRSKALWNTTIELVHTGFDILGLIPVGGEVFDFANGVIYTIQGDGLNATFSFAATLPIAGWASTGAKYAVLSVKTAIGAKNLKITRNAVTGFFEFSHAQQFRKMVGVTDIEQEAHHLIPKNVWESPLVQLAAQGKSTFFHGNHPKNGIAVKKFTTNLLDGIHANHPNYDIRLNLLLNREMGKLTALFGSNIPPDEAAKKLIEIQDFLKALIQNNPDIKIDDLIF